MTAPTRARCGAVVVSAALAIAVAAGVGGCSPRLLESDGGLLVVVASDNNGMEALIVGELATTPGGCLGVRADDTGAVTMLAAPPGTTLSGADAVVMPGYGRLALGEQVSLGGGGGPVEQWAEWVEIPEECAAESEIFLVNASR